MTDSPPKVRLFVEAPLGEELAFEPDRAQANYLFNVMRLGPGDAAALFNGRDGEWRAEVAEAHRRGGRLVCRARLRAQDSVPDLWLLFAPLKKQRTDLTAEKATEMGCARLAPVFTDFTSSERINVDRLRAHAVEAAEQCGVLTVPDIAEPRPLDALLDDWDPVRRLMFCDEARDAAPAASALSTAAPGPWAVLIGPEGGFSPRERARLKSLPFALPVSLGPRVLRADTAAVAALTAWQGALGDWREG